MVLARTADLVYFLPVTTNANADFGWNLDNTYARLPETLFARVNPTPVRSAKLAVLNHELTAALGLDATALLTPAGTAILAGNVIPQGSEPLAQAYAGHQFGRFTMLGDGRANLLGEHLTPKGERFDIQLKGSGPSPYSRNGDGRAALGPMLREYIISEAMHGLGIPTTRSLAVVTTGEPVFRETTLPGAVLTRVASSHIRVGTFEYAAALSDQSCLRVLADYTFQRHYPELLSQDEPYLSLLLTVIERQASLIAQWMLNGFIHGVMNTDNMTLSGETIDYGPCAFMDHYSPTTVFSSIDSHGRYAFGQQPRIAKWNLTRLAETLLPLIHPNEEQATVRATEALNTFEVVFQRHWLRGMRTKLGLVTEDPEDLQLIESLLHLMEQHKADYTSTFRALASDELPKHILFSDASFLDWHRRWRARQPSQSLMYTCNPSVIARNHRVEEALSAAVEREDYSVMERLLVALKNPFQDLPENADYRQPPPFGGPAYETFCGT